MLTFCSFKKDLKGGGCLEGYDAVTERSKLIVDRGVGSTQPIGNPIIISTKRGLSTGWEFCPGISIVWSWGENALDITVSDVIAVRGPPGIRAFMARCASTVFWSSCATGVGHNAALSVKERE
jgi:hypothetical protein